MLHLRIYGPSGAMEDVGQGLERGGDARHVTLVPAVRPGHALLTAEVAPEAADQVLEYLLRRGLAQEDVALPAAISGMLAFETRAAAAVGVAISVTTIPAAAYLGVAAGLGETDKAGGALAVLAVNIGLLLVGGTATLAIQRWGAHAQKSSQAG